MGEKKKPLTNSATYGRHLGGPAAEAAPRRSALRVALFFFLFCRAMSESLWLFGVWKMRRDADSSLGGVVEWILKRKKDGEDSKTSSEPELEMPNLPNVLGFAFQKPEKNTYFPMAKTFTPREHRTNKT